MTKAAQQTARMSADTATKRATLIRFSPEWWAFWGGVWAVLLTAGAALAGIVAWYFSLKVGEESERRTQTLELRLSEQQERTAKAEKDLAVVKSQAAPRTLLSWAFIDALQNGRSKARLVTLWYLEDDGEALEFAQSLVPVLSGTGWPTKGPEPIPESFDRLNLKPTSVTIVARTIGGGPGRSDVISSPGYEELMSAFLGRGWIVGGREDPTLAPDELTLIVMAKP